MLRFQCSSKIHEQSVNVMNSNINLNTDLCSNTSTCSKPVLTFNKSVNLSISFYFWWKYICICVLQGFAEISQWEFNSYTGYIRRFTQYLKCGGFFPKLTKIDVFGTLLGLEMFLAKLLIVINVTVYHIEKLVSV